MLVFLKLSNKVNCLNTSVMSNTGYKTIRTCNIERNLVLPCSKCNNLLKDKKSG